MKQDRYKNFSQLAQHEVAGKDYTIETQDRSATATVLAIHGGNIEPGTSGIARALAGQDYNLYLFEGRGWDLHIASHRFDEPQAVALAEKSQICVTIHAFIEETPLVCIGGNNTRLKECIAGSLLKTGLTSQKSGNPIERFQGTSKMNIANRCLDGGTQIEISTGLMDILRADPQKTQIFVGSLRAAIRSYLHPAPASTPKGPKP